MVSDFATRIKLLQKEKEMSQTEIAKRYGLDRTSVGKWEANVSAPDIETLQDLANLFGVSMDYLTGVSDIRNPYEPDTIAAHHDADEFTEDELRAIEEFKETVRRLRQNR